MTTKTDKEFYLEWWTPTIGLEEALRTWEVKQTMPAMRADYHIMPDIAPYQSMKTGEMICGRAAHREHLKKHNLQEIGNETKYLQPKTYKPDPSIREDIGRAVYNQLGPF
jgi:hypothetical protein